MTVKTVFEHEKFHNIGLSTDTKPAGQTPLSTFYEYDTFKPFVTYDGTNWVVDTRPSKVDILEVRVSKAIDASLGAYAANDVVNDDDCSTTATYWTFSGMANAVGGYGVIESATIFSESENISPRLTLILFNAAPTGELTDNSANTNPLPADRAKYVGEIDFPAMSAVSASVASVSFAGPSTVGGLPLFYKCAAASTTLYGVLKTLDAFTQTATDDIEIALQVRKL